MEKKARRNPNIEIDILPILKALLSRLWLILLVGVITALISFGATKILIKPTYRSSFTAYVNNQQVHTSKEYLSSSDLSAMKELVRTYSKILTSNSLLTASAESADMDLPYSTLKNIVSTEISDETEIITVHVVAREPEKAYDLAKAISKTAPSFMANIVEGSSMKIIDEPELPTDRYKPSYLRYGILGFLLGALLTAIITIIRQLKNDSVMDESKLENQFGLPILGVIPDTLQLDKDGKGYYSKYSSYEYKHHNDEKESGKV